MGNPMPRISAVLVTVAGVAALALPALAKKQNPAAVALFKKAIASSDLEAKGSAAYRLQATVRVFGANNEHTDGILVEFWTPDGKWREETILQGYQLVVVSDGQHLWTKNTANYLPYDVHELWTALAFTERLRWWLAPTKNTLWVAGAVERTLFPGQKVHLDKPRKEKKLRDECVEGEISGGLEEDFCFDSASGHLLRVLGQSDIDGSNYEFSNYVAIGRKSFPSTLRVTEGQSRELLEIHIDEINPLTRVSPGTFLPMQGSSEEPAPATCSRVEMGDWMRRVKPLYPPAAARKRVAGYVGFYGYVGIDGVIRGLVPLWSPAQVLTAAALQAISQTRFRPTVCESGGVAQSVPRIAYPATDVRPGN